MWMNCKNLNISKNIGEGLLDRILANKVWNDTVNFTFVPWLFPAFTVCYQNVIYLLQGKGTITTHWLLGEKNDAHPDYAPPEDRESFCWQEATTGQEVPLSSAGHFRRS